MLPGSPGQPGPCLARRSDGAPSLFAEIVAYCQSRRGRADRRGRRHQEEGIVPLDPETGQSPRGTSHYKFGAQAVEVEVDPETGRLSIIRAASAHDCGRAINPLQATGQVQGAVVQGLGFALLEEVRFEDGRVTNPSLGDYSIPTACDVPVLQTFLVERGHAEGPYGAKGVGEPGIIGIAAAIGNAVQDAASLRIRDLPITAEKILQARPEEVPS